MFRFAPLVSVDTQPKAPFHVSTNEELKRAEDVEHRMNCEHLNNTIKKSPSVDEQKIQDCADPPEPTALEKWSTQMALLLKLFFSQYHVGAKIFTHTFRCALNAF